MLRYLLILILCFPILNAFAQNGKVFYMGAPEGFTVAFDFTEGDLESYVQDGITIDFQFGSQSFWWNEDGSVRLCSNGSWISNAQGDTISWLLERNRDIDFWRVDWIGYNQWHSGVFLPDPADTSIVHFLYNNTAFFNGIYCSQKLLSAQILLREPPLKDTLISEGNILFYDEDIYHDGGQLLPIQHANGKDWWIWRHRRESNLFDVILLDETGFHFSHTFESGANFVEGSDAYALSWNMDQLFMVSSIFLEDPLEVAIHDIDRCAGTMTQKDRFVVRDQALNPESTVINSMDGHFLYVLTADRVYQYDLWEEDIKSSEVIVGQFFSSDTCSQRQGQSVFRPSSFDLPFLAPDGKIYIFNRGNCSDYSVINNPDRKGEECNLDAFAYHPPNRVLTVLINNPNYDIGALPEGSCITSSHEISKGAFGLKISPNPSTDQVKVEWPKDINIQYVDVYGSSGHLVNSYKTISTSEVDFDVDSLSSGIYYVVVRNKENQVLGQEKLIIR